ncbi:MAG: AraC family transcriptional regulator [Steroidobacteraceae bacterium]
MINVVRSASLTNYAEVARKAGLDPARMLREFGLPPQCLQEPELKLPADSVRRLLEASAERSGVEGFGLMMAEARRLSDLGPLGLLIREQPTLRLAVEAFVRHGRRLNDSLFLTIEETGQVLVLREELIVGSSGPVRQSTELAIGVAHRMLCSFLGPQWHPRRVCFAHEPPKDRSVHDRVFGRNVVEFGHDFNGIVCARKDLDLPNPNADPGIARLAREIIESRDTASGPSMTSQVRDLVIGLLAAGNCTVETVAHRLGVDRRTVHRHLAREGESFSGILESVRKELAERYVREGRRSLSDVSAMLGFAAPGSFSRWYRHQFGTSPSSGARRYRTPPR